MNNLAAITLGAEELPDLASLDRARADLQVKLAEQGSELARADWGLVRGEVAKALQPALAGLDLIQCLGWAWRKARELQRLGEETARSGDTQPLPLCAHPLAIDIHPVVTVTIGGVPLPELRFTLRLEAEVSWAVLIVTAGRLTSIESAKIELSATLLYGEQVVEGPFKKGFDPGPPYRFAEEGILLAEPPGDRT